METQQSRIGQVVRLRSGGPDMTINAEDDSNETLTCVWFDQSSSLKEYTFHKDALIDTDSSFGDSESDIES